MNLGARGRIGVLASGLLLAALPGRPGTAAQAVRPPSILVVLTDDMATGDTDAMAAVQERLVRAGASFSAFLTSNPSCCPSRATFLRGQYAHNHGVLTNRPPLGGYACFRQLGRENSTVATWLRGAGYRTGLFGKYLNGYPLETALAHVPQGWDTWFCPFGIEPYEAYGYSANHDGRIVSFGYGRRDHLTGVLSDRAHDFLVRASADGVPFFALVAPYAPHEPSTPAPEDEVSFEGAEAPRTPSLFEDHGGEKPYYVRSRGPLGKDALREIDGRYRKRQASLRSVDRMTARLLDALEAAGRLDDTFVLFLSDNGYHLGEHGLAHGKGAPYESDVRVPLIVRGPGVPAGATIPHLAGNTDLAPTLAAIAGVAPPDFVDGRSLLPLLGPAPPAEDSWRRSFLLEHVNASALGSRAAAAYERRRRPRAEDLYDLPAVTGVYPFFRWRFPRRGHAPPSYVGLRTSTFKIVQYGTREREVYLLGPDPHEMANFERLENVDHYDDDDAAGLVGSILHNLTRASGEECRSLEDHPLPEYP